MAGAEGFGRQRGPEPFDALLAQQRVVEHTGQVRHACQRGQFRADPFQEFRDLGFVADIGREDVDTGLVPLGDLVDRLLRVRVGRAPAGQHEIAGAELGQVRRGVQADRAETAGDQVRAISLGLQRVRDLHHDLADVARLLHAAERGPGLGQRVDLGGQWLPVAFGESLRNFNEQVANAIGFGEHHRVQRDDLVGDVGPGLGHPLR